MDNMEYQKTLTPDKQRFENGVLINEKIIPLNAVWEDAAKAEAAGCKKGDPYRSRKKLAAFDYVVIHNTPDVVTSTGDEAETYTRATWPNENMKTSRVHFFVDKNSAWQNLEEDYRGWHVGTGDGGDGNRNGIAIEIIESTKNEDAEDNGARLAAYLMMKYNIGLGNVVPHQYFAVKNCPEVVIPRWKDFLDRVSHYCNYVKIRRKLIAHDGKVKNPPASEWRTCMSGSAINEEIEKQRSRNKCANCEYRR